MSSSPRQKPFLTTYRPRPLADGTGWPCSRSRLISLCIRYSPPLAQVGKSLSSFLSLAVYTPRRFSVFAFFFTIARPIFCTISLANRGHRISCSQSRPVQFPVPCKQKSSLPSRAKQKKVVTCGPLFLPLACGIGIRLTNVPSSAGQKGCMGLTLSRNGFGRRGETLSRIPDTWKMYGGWLPSSLTHGKTE